MFAHCYDSTCVHDMQVLTLAHDMSLCYTYVREVTKMEDKRAMWEETPQRRNHTVMVKLTADEIAEIEAAARAAGNLTRAAYLRAEGLKAARKGQHDKTT